MDDIITICSWCMLRASDDLEWTWRNITDNDISLEKQGKASHGMCPDCEDDFNKKWGDNDGLDE